MRKNAQVSLKKLRVEEANKLIIPLINSFTATLEALNLFESNDVLTRKEEANGDADSSNFKWPSPKGFCEFISCVSTFSNLSDDALRTVALSCLLLSSTPLAKQTDPKLYEKFLSKLLANNSQIKHTIFQLLKLLNKDLVNLTTNTDALNQVIHYFKFIWTTLFKIFVFRLS